MNLTSLGTVFGPIDSSISPLHCYVNDYADGITRWPALNRLVLDSFVNLGQIQGHAGNEDAARACGQKAVKWAQAILEKSRGLTHWSHLGQALFYLRQWHDASEVLEMAIEQRGDGNSREAYIVWSYLTMTLHQLGETETARSYYNKLIKQLEEKTTVGPEHMQLRAEAAKVLGIVPDD